MSAHNVNAALFAAQSEIPDPGSSGTIYVSKSLAACNLVTAGAETRTLARPTRANALLILNARTISTSCTITPTGGYDEFGGTTIVFTEAGQFAILFSIETATAGTYIWRLIATHATGNLSGLVATVTELNRAADVSTRIVNCTASTLAVTEAEHDGKIILLDRAAGIAVTLPSASVGLRFEFIVKTTFTSAASIKSVVGTDIMIGHAIMGNDSDNAVVNWQAVAANTFDTINLLGTANSTGGMAGQRIRITGLATALWYVEIIGDAGGTEATPFEDTVA